MTKKVSRENNIRGGGGTYTLPYIWWLTSNSKAKVIWRRNIVLKYQPRMKKHAIKPTTFVLQLGCLFIIKTNICVAYIPDVIVNICACDIYLCIKDCIGLFGV